MADNVTIVGFAELQAALEKSAAQALEVTRRQVAASGLELETEAKKNLTAVGGVDTGQARAATRYRASDGGMGAEVASPNPVAAAIEFGTAPAGALKQHFPPPKALEGWARRHGMTEPGAAFLIARKIALRGIPARPWLSKAHDTIAPKFESDLKSAINKLLDSL